MADRIPCTNPACREGQVVRSERCQTCGGDGEVIRAGKVVECPNPKCFFGSVAKKGVCPTCKGKGYIEKA